MALIYTLKLHKWVLEAAGRVIEENLLLDTAIKQLHSFHEAGGEVLFGTDVGFMSDYDPADEYVLMAKEGMVYDQILAALTTAPAKRFGRDLKNGKIFQGMDADLILYLADPAKYIKNFTKVKYTIHWGKIIYP